MSGSQGLLTYGNDDTQAVTSPGLLSNGRAPRKTRINNVAPPVAFGGPKGGKRSLASLPRGRITPTRIPTHSLMKCSKFTGSVLARNPVQIPIIRWPSVGITRVLTIITIIKTKLKFRDYLLLKTLSRLSQKYLFQFFD